MLEERQTGLCVNGKRKGKGGPNGKSRSPRLSPVRRGKLPTWGLIDGLKGGLRPA